MYGTWTEYAKAREPEIRAIERIIERIERARDEKQRRQLINELRKRVSSEDFAYYCEWLNLNA